MKIFLAGCAYEVWKNTNDFDFYRLHTFFHIQKAETLNIHRYKDFLLDSGAFSMFGGKQVDLNAYVQNYIKYINENNVQHFFELDLYTLPQYGVATTEQIRQSIINGTGKKPIPVFHYTLGFDYFKYLCDNFEYIAISVSGMYTSKWTRERPDILKGVVQYANNAGCKVHGLGYTDLNNLSNIPFYSVDSTSWLSGARFGGVAYFTGNGIKNIPKPKGLQMISSVAIKKHNFYEWVKFQKYAEKNL